MERVGAVAPQRRGMKDGGRVLRCRMRFRQLCTIGVTTLILVGSACSSSEPIDRLPVDSAMLWAGHSAGLIVSWAPVEGSCPKASDHHALLNGTEMPVVSRGGRVWDGEELRCSRQARFEVEPRPDVQTARLTIGGLSLVAPGWATPQTCKIEGPASVRPDERVSFHCIGVNGLQSAVVEFNGQTKDLVYVDGATFMFDVPVGWRGAGELVVHATPTIAATSCVGVPVCTVIGLPLVASIPLTVAP